MSANNWTECPICKINLSKEVARIQSSTKAKYGKISLEEYLEADKQANKEIGELYQNDVETFREDYSIGITEKGAFAVEYSGRCEKCGAGYHFAFEKIKAVKNLIKVRQW